MSVKPMNLGSIVTVVGSFYPSSMDGRPVFEVRCRIRRQRLVTIHPVRLFNAMRALENGGVSLVVRRETELTGGLEKARVGNARIPARQAKGNTSVPFREG